MKRSHKNRFLVKHRVSQRTFIIEFGKLHRVLSSAPRGGGLVRARSILNHYVQANPLLRGDQGRPDRNGRTQWTDPARYLGRVASRLKAASPIVALMTAVPMEQLVKDREESGGIWVECFCTVGVTNAVRAGEPGSHDGRRRRCDRVGTINIILVTNATLAVPAMVGAVQVVTESKTAALMEKSVRSSSGVRYATGTGTDAVVVVSSIDGILRVQYSGTHTCLGSMIGRLVVRCVREGLARSGRWHTTAQGFSARNKPL
jgi:adenosylcobinamide hydrolase